jgi:hypothetical protein
VGKGPYYGEVVKPIRAFGHQEATALNWTSAFWKGMAAESSSAYVDVDR